jgi:GNAT superfamily N-acetyltransferase
MSALESTRAECSESHSCNLPTGLARLKPCWWDEDRLTESLDLGLATDRGTLEQAFRLVHDQYVARGYMAPCPSGWRLSLHNALPSTKVFVARSGGRVVGTVTLIPDSPLGLPMSEIYSDELQALRERGRRLGEVSALVVDPEFKRIGMAILMRLIRMMVVYAAQTARLEDLCIAINPHHAALYRKAFDFETIGAIKHYGKVNGAPAIALRLDLGLVRLLIRELEDEHPGLAAVYGFLFGPEACREVLDRISVDLEREPFPRAHFEYFLRHHPAWLEASAADRAYVLSHHGEPITARIWNLETVGSPALTLAAAS